MLLRILVLLLKCVEGGRVLGGLPLVEAIDLVQRNAEGRVLLPQQLNRLERLLLQSVHDVYDQDGHVTKTAAATAQVGERLVTRSVDNQESRDLQVHWVAVL